MNFSVYLTIIMSLASIGSARRTYKFQPSGNINAGRSWMEGLSPRELAILRYKLCVLQHGKRFC